MAGLLNRLQRRTKRGASTGMQDLLFDPQSSTPGALSGNSNSPLVQPTEFRTTNEDLGEAKKLLEELKVEAQEIVRESARNKEYETTFRTKKIIGSKLRVLQKSKDTLTKPGVLDDVLPWWLTEGNRSSPQVDLLVPKAREALNELLANDVRREELPLIIRKGVNAAAQQLAGEVRLSTQDIEDAVTELLSLMTGKGPIQALYADPAVTDIFLDGHNNIKCVRRGHALETPFRFRSADEYEAYVTGMLQSIDRVLNLSSPIVDCVLKDNWRSRINAVHSSLLDKEESSVVVRVPRLQQITFYDILQTKTLPSNLAAWLAELVAIGEANILVCGPTGSGKTVITTALLSAVGSDERIVTIEDVPEIFVPTAHLEKLVTRPKNAQGEGEVQMHDLLRAALRRAPHRIVVGEIRDREGPLFLKALETGHRGSVATIHAETPRDALWRLLDVVTAYEQAPQESIQRRISRSVNMVISMRRINGTPCLVDVCEVHPPVGGEFVVKNIVKFEKEVDGKRYWRVAAMHSILLDRLRKTGTDLVPGPGLLPIEDSLAEKEI